MEMTCLIQVVEELRTCLTIIAGHVELLAPRGREDITDVQATVRDAVERAEEALRQLHEGVQRS